MRAVTSEDPPEYGTMMRTGLLGNALGGTGCACTTAVKRKSAPEAIALLIVDMLPFIVRLPELRCDSSAPKHAPEPRV